MLHRWSRGSRIHSARRWCCGTRRASPRCWRRRHYPHGQASTVHDSLSTLSAARQVNANDESIRARADPCPNEELTRAKLTLWLAVVMACVELVADGAVLCGVSGERLSRTLSEGCPLVSYGCTDGNRAPQLRPMLLLAG